MNVFLCLLGYFIVCSGVAHSNDHLAIILGSILGIGAGLKALLDATPPDDKRKATPMTTTPMTTTTWGEPYNFDPAYQTPDGPVWMYRKGRKVRYFDADGRQVGPEQENVAPAVAYAHSLNWQWR